MPRRPLVAILTCALLAVACAAPSLVSAAPPPVRHVFVVVLENKSYGLSFPAANAQAPYLSMELPRQGQLLSNFYGITHFSLGNYLAMLSGQGPNPQVQADCQRFTDFAPGAPGADGQAIGQGCVFPRQVNTLPNQLEANGLSWGGYMEDMGNGKNGEAKTCRHPAIGAADDTQSAEVGDQYAARHNPFVYFHSLIDFPSCAQDDVPLDQLPRDLASVDTTKNLTFITPNLCNDGHDTPCVDGRPGGLVSADAFLRQWVPRITGSPAFQKDGLLIVTFDEAGTGGVDGPADASACCNEPTGPNTANNGGPLPGQGGGRIGAVLLSPFIAPGGRNATPYNHYSLLRSFEDVFGLNHLGYAARADLRPFGDDVYTRPQGVPSVPTAPGAAPCGDRRLARPRGARFARGQLIRTATARRSGSRRAVVTLRLEHVARVKVASGRYRRSLRLSACRTYRLRVPRGRIVVQARLPRGSERRVVRT